MKNLIKTQTQAYDWFADRYQAIFVSRNRWLLTALVGLMLAMMQAAALLFLIPLKTSVPFLVKEETSGAVTTVTRLQGDSTVTYSEAVRKYFLARYVLFRETYDPIDLAENYRAVGLMSSEPERRAFDQAIASSNPASPLNVYGGRARRLIRIKSIAFLSPQTAQVRLSAIEERSTAQAVTREWIVTIAFHFGALPALEAERLVNPLGFTVTHYRIDQEVIP